LNFSRVQARLPSSTISEVVMGRSPEVFIRPVTMTEGQRLQRIGRTSKDPVKLRRAIVVLMSCAVPKGQTLLLS
jgi:hypothetical protein